MAKKIVDEKRTAPVRSRGNLQKELMVAEAKMLCTELWPEEFGDLTTTITEELKSQVLAAVKQLPAESAWRVARLVAFLQDSRGPTVPAYEPPPRGRPALRLIQGGLAS